MSESVAALCRYVVSMTEDGLHYCGHAAVEGEHYCRQHIHLVHRRTNVQGEDMPDRPNAPWKG